MAVTPGKAHVFSASTSLPVAEEESATLNWRVENLKRFLRHGQPLLSLDDKRGLSVLAQAPFEFDMVRLLCSV